MATLTAQLKANVTGINSDTISVDVTTTPTVIAGGIVSRSIDTNSAAGEKIVEADYYAAGTYVYLRNRDTSIVITIQLSAATAGEIVLGAGQWALFPWAGAIDILAFSASGAPVLEVGVFSGA